ncbi:hypothetical protein Tco_0331987 [Tanacetum coccineum]
MNYEPVTTENQSNGDAGIETNVNACPNINTASPTPNDSIMQSLENTGIFDDAYDDREVGADAECQSYSHNQNSQGSSDRPDHWRHKFSYSNKKDDQDF